MKKRIPCLLLALALTLGLLPLSAFAEEETHSVRLTGTSSDFMSGYYVTYELNGVEYRSDQVGSAVNRLAWNGMSDSDRRTLMYVYAFAPDRRMEQFGADGSQEMADYINEKQGWTALWAAYADRIEQQECGPLTEYFSDENYDAQLRQLQDNARGGADSWYSRLMNYSSYPEAQAVRQKYDAIAGVMGTGKSAYNCIVRAYTKARQASVRAISKELISIIVDKTLTPNITVAPTAATTSVYTGISDLFFAVTGYSDQLTQRVVGQTQGGMDAVELINAMRELARLNYQLAYRCYTEAKSLSDSIPAEAEAALKICEEKRKNEEFERLQKEEKARQEAEARARAEAQDAEKLKTLYDKILGDTPVWDPEPGLGPTAYEEAFNAYVSLIPGYIAARRELYESEYAQLSEDYQAWYDKYMAALAALNEQHTMEYPRPKYSFTDPSQVYYVYIDFTNEQMADYEKSSTEYTLELRNYAADRMEYTEAARELLNEAIAEYKVLQSRNQALYETRVFGYVVSVDSNGKPNWTEAVYFHEGQWDVYFTKDAEGVGADRRKEVLDALSKAANDWGETRSEGIESGIRTLEEMKAELIRMRKNRLEHARKRINDYNSLKDNFDLAVQFGEQSRDKQDALLESLPDWVSEFSGSLSDVANAGPKLTRLLEGANDPLAKARALGRELSAKLDEFNRLQRCIDNADAAVEYYTREMRALYNAELYPFNGREEACGLPRIQSWGDDYNAFKAYIKRDRTAAQKHNLSALRTLTADLSGWGGAHTQLSLKLAELKATKSALIRRLQSDRDAAPDLLRALGYSFTQLYSSYARNSFYGYARHQAYQAGKPLSGDVYGEAIALIEWLREHYADYVLPTGIRKKDSALLSRGGDELLMAAGDAAADLVLAAAGDRGQLRAEVTPSDATEKGIVWQSLDPEIASVDESGVVTALAPGEARILARALDAPAEAIRENPEDESSPAVGFAYDEAFTVTFTVRVEEGDFRPAQGDGTVLWRNLGSDEAPCFTRSRTENGVTTVTAVFRAEPDANSLCMALYDAHGRMLACTIVRNDGFADALSVRTEGTPARVRVFLLDAAMHPCSAPPLDEFL